MAASTFGRRGQRVNAQTESTSAISPIAMRDPRLLVAMIEPNVPERTILDDIPFLTIGVMFFLMIVFGLEKRFAYDFGKGATLSLQSLIAFGAVSYDLSVGSGEYWRVLLAPLLHASYSHVIGNVIALFFAGVRL